MPQPTLPTLEIDEFSPAARAGPKSNYASSFATSTAKDDAYAYSEYPPDLHGAPADYPPPMPLYDQNAYAGGGQPAFNKQHYDQNSMYPPSERHPQSEFVNSSTHLARAVDGEYYGDEHIVDGGHSHYGGNAAHAGTEAPPYGQAFDDNRDQKRTSAYSAGSGLGLAYDVPEQPTTPHRRTASGAGSWQARQHDEDVVLQQQAHAGHSYQQQWPGYGPTTDQYGREQYPHPGHGRQGSRGGGSESHAM